MLKIFKKKKAPQGDKQVFVVLEDKPLKNGEDDGFGHREIAASVVEVIKKSPKPFNIGIYGQWGVGKSTICKIIERRLLEEAGYKVFYFDTWKYERDSFRRQFLITLDNDLCLGLDFKNRLNQSLTEIDPTLGEIKFNTRLVVNKVAFLALVFLAVGLLGLFLDVFTDTAGGYNLFFSVTASLGLATFMVQLAVNAISRVQTSITKSKTDTAEGFEEHFAEALAKIQKNDLLVIVDNLDRLSSEKAVGLLSDIKTFLSDERYCFKGENVNNKAVFVIPCDNKAINAQLLKEYGEDFDTEEYLRKFFNHSIQIPKFLSLELDDFIIKKLNITQIEELKNNYDLVFILSYAFRNNPREIIQFINSLISLYLLAKERKISRVIAREHVAFLAKVLVLRIKWPLLYDEIENRMLETGDKLGEIIRKIEYRNREEKSIQKEKEEKLASFFNRTSHIDDLEYQDVYFSLRQTEQQKAIPEWGSFVLSLLDGRVSDADKIYTAVKLGGKLPELGKLLGLYCRKHRHNENSILNIFLTIHRIIKPEDIEYFHEMFLLAFEHAGSKLNSSLEVVDFTNLFTGGLQGVSPAVKNEFIKVVVSLITVATSNDPINKERIKHIKKLLEITDSSINREKFENYVEQIAAAKTNLIKNSKKTELFPDFEKGEKFREDILDDLLAIVATLGLTDSRHYAVGLTLFSGLLQWPPIIENKNACFKILENSLVFLNKSQPPSTDDGTVGGVLDIFTSNVLVRYSLNSSVEEKSLCVKIFKTIDIGINPNKNPGVSIKQYVAEVGNTAEDVLSTLGKDFIINDEQARKGLIERSRISLDLLDKLSLGKKLTGEEKADILSHLIGKPEMALKFLDYTGFVIPSERIVDPAFLKNTAQGMINSCGLSDATLFARWLDAIAKLGVGSDQVGVFVQKLRQVRDLSDQHKRVVADFVTRNVKDFGELVAKELQP